MGVETQGIQDLAFEVQQTVAIDDVGGLGEVVCIWIMVGSGRGGGDGKGRARGEQVVVDVCDAAEGTR